MFILNFRGLQPIFEVQSVTWCACALRRVQFFRLSNFSPDILIKFPTKTPAFFWIESLKTEKRTLNGSKYRVSPRAFVVTGTNRQQFETDGCAVIDWWREGELRTCRWRARPKRWRQRAAAVAAARECLTRKKRARLLYTHCRAIEQRVQWTFWRLHLEWALFWNVPFLKCVSFLQCALFGMWSNEMWPKWNVPFLEYAQNGIWSK